MLVHSSFLRNLEFIPNISPLTHCVDYQMETVKRHRTGPSNKIEIKRSPSPRPPLFSISFKYIESTKTEESTTPLDASVVDEYGR